MSKFIALAAFNTAVAATNAVHATKRGVVKAACAAKDATVAGATTTKEVGAAFWAGFKYANQVNKTQGATAEYLKTEDIAPQDEVEVVVEPAPKAKPKARTTRAKVNEADVTDVEVKIVTPRAKTAKAKAKA